MKTLLPVLATAAAALAAMPAAAVTFTFTPAGGGTVAPGFTKLYDFNGNSGLTGSGFGYFTTSISNVAAMPAGSDGSTYVAVDKDGSATASLGAGASAISLYIGSVDASNAITFNYLGGGFDVLLGSVLAPPANGDRGSSATNGLFVFTAAPGKTFASIGFGSGQTAFEFDDLAVAPPSVPEPAAWAMMILGFGLIGSSARRRRGTLAMASA